MKSSAQIRARVTAAAVAAVAALGLALGGRSAHTGTSDAGARAPQRLADTGLYADFDARVVAAENEPYSPQYPLWTDGATKRRWIHLPAGTSIDASNPDAWSFPVGTKLWKEFSFGRRVETRYMELGREGWIYATYAWSEDERDAVLAPEYGVRAAVATALGTRHDVPGVADCRVCHEGGASAVLGFSALQLSPDRDPLAPHAEAPSADALDLAKLMARGSLRNAPREWNERAPRIDAASERSRAALGYLHANCGMCHNAAGQLSSLGLELDQHLADRDDIPALRTALGQPSRFLPSGWSSPVRIAPGAPEDSVLVTRMSSRAAVTQMPPLGTHAVDREALALVTEWIRADLVAPHDAAGGRAIADNPNSMNQEPHR